MQELGGQSSVRISYLIGWAQALGISTRAIFYCKLGFGE